MPGIGSAAPPSSTFKQAYSAERCRTGAPGALALNMDTCMATLLNHAQHCTRKAPRCTGSTTQLYSLHLPWAAQGWSTSRDGARGTAVGPVKALILPLVVEWGRYGREIQALRGRTHQY